VIRIRYDLAGDNNLSAGAQFFERSRDLRAAEMGPPQ
jgi:hypothetical protein